MELTRRKVLLGVLAGSGLMLGFMLRPRVYPLPLEPSEGEFAFDAWIRISSEGVVTVAVPQVEMGQGISTLLPQIVAHELGADWRQMASEPAPVSAHYANYALAAKWASLWLPEAPSWASAPDDMLTRRWATKHRFNATADGTALAAYEAPLRAAAASARAMLMQAAAERWNVAWEECEAKAGFILHNDKRIAFGPLAEEAAQFSPPSTPPLRLEPMAEDPDEFPLGGALRYPRLDLTSKVDGSWNIAGDIRLPDMVYAAIRHAPLGERASVSGVDEKAAKSVRGYLAMVQGADWVAAVATNGWSAEQALTQLAPRFKVAVGADSKAIDKSLDEAMYKGPATTVHSKGDRTLVEGGLPFQVRYEVAPAVHATLETGSAVARYRDGRLELWVGTQAPEATRKAAADAVDIRLKDVVLYPLASGGSFDRRLEFTQAIEAAIIAKAIGKPVQLTWSRKEEFRASLPRTPVVAVMGARSDAEGSATSWRARIAVPATAKEFGARLFDGKAPFDALDAVAGDVDPMAIEGGVPAYDISNVMIDHVTVRIGLPTGRMRGNAHGWTAFFNECFVDELAHQAGREPLSYRMSMLGQDVRLAECLQKVAALSEWGGGVRGSGQGLACHALGEGRIAVVAQAMRGADGVKVTRLSAVADIGRIVNFDIARQQIEGGLIFGLGLTLGCSVRYVGGLPQKDRLVQMGLPLLNDCPEIDVSFISSTKDPVDPGELGVAVVAPAVANALFSATGQRLRRLPFLAEDQ